MMALERAKMKRGLWRKSVEIRKKKGRRVKIHKRKKRSKHNSRRRSVFAMLVKRLYVFIVLCFSVLMLLNASMEITLRNRGIEGKRKRKFEGGGEGER
jgi:cell division septal protein FtsQ